MPIYFLVLGPTRPEAILVMQVVMTFIVLALLRLVSKYPTRNIPMHEHLKVSLVPALLIATNWLIYLLAMLTGNAVDAGLSYLFTPFIIIILSRTILGERLETLQTVGTTVCVLAVLAYTIGSGLTPIYAIGLALSFGCYAIWHRYKRVPDSIAALHGELTLIAPVAACFLIFMAIGDQTITVSTWGLLALLGPLTLLPLFLFVTACRSQISAVQLAACQFIAPIVSITIGITLMGQTLTPALGWLIATLMIGVTIGLVPIIRFKGSPR